MMSRLLVVLVSFVIEFGVVAYAAQHHEAQGVKWMTENPAKILEDAKSQGKQVFLYWGAVWCPPCNAMKADVFSKPEFQAALKDMVPVMIDGDSADAQKWSDRFNVSGYPTMLVLGADGAERMRFADYTPLATMEAALNAVNATSESLAPLMQKMVKVPPQLTEAEWRQVSYSDWSKFSAEDFGGKAPAELALELTKSIPANLHVEKAILASFVLMSAPDGTPEFGKQVSEQYDTLLAMVSVDDTTLLRSQLLFTDGYTALKYLTENGVSLDQKRARVAAWASSLERLSKVMGDSLLARVNLAGARVSLAKFQPVDAKRTIQFRQELEVLRKEMNGVKDAHLQIALFPTLADAYEANGDHDVALKILQRAASHSTAPWYFYSHEAHLIKEAGDMNAAIPLYEQAMRAAKGPSTRIQWTWNYLNAVEKSTIKDRSLRIQSTVGDLFKLAVRAPDGFNGRNIRSLKKARDLVIKVAPENKKLLTVVTSVRKQCDAIKDETQAKTCADFFEPMLKALPAEKAPERAG